MKLLLAAVFCLLNCAGFAAQSPNPFEVKDHLAETWWTEEEQQAFFTNRIALDPKLARQMADQLSSSPSDPSEPHSVQQRQETRSHLTNRPPYFVLPDFQHFQQLRSPALRNLAAQLSHHTNVAVQLFALMSMAGTGDRSAAESILKFAQRKDLSSNDVVVLRNLFHGMGFDPLHDKPEIILKMTAAAGPDHDDERERNLLPLGTVAPDFEIKTLAGKPIKLSDYRGKTVLLHFWSTSCGPCIGEFPEMTKGLREFRRYDLVVLAVNLDDNRKIIERAIEKHDLGDWTHVCDGRGWGSAPARLYGVTSIPHDYLIDYQGIIRGRDWREVAKAPKPSGTKK